jgi:hypothetical protein
MQNNEGLFKPFSCESYEMSSGGYIQIKKETPSTCWKLYAKELLQTAYESPSHYQVNIRKDFKGIKPTTIKKMEVSIMKTDKKMTSKSHWSVLNKYKKIEYKGYLIEKYTWGRKQYQYFLSKDGVQILRDKLLPYENLEPSIYNKKQCGLSIKNYKLLIDKYLTKETI